jgi:imidazole glycerol phosphate synthase subunit HisF
LYQAWLECGREWQLGITVIWIVLVTQDVVGQLYLNSMNHDGTWQRYDLQLLNLLPASLLKPVILEGCLGNTTHLAKSLLDQRLDAVAISHLFNFVGDGLKQVHNSLIPGRVELPLWNIQLLEQHLGSEQPGEAQLD